MTIEVPAGIIALCIGVFFAIVSAFNAGRSQGRDDVIDHGWHRNPKDED